MKHQEYEQDRRRPRGLRRKQVGLADLAPQAKPDRISSWRPLIRHRRKHQGANQPAPAEPG